MIFHYFNVLKAQHIPQQPQQNKIDIIIRYITVNVLKLPHGSYK